MAAASPPSVPFFKYEGLGNDFILLDAESCPDLTLNEGLISGLCDRHRGIGADGVLWVAEGPSMVVWNADGSRPEMCGNGLRCVVRYLADRGRWGLGEPRDVLTDAGRRRCTRLDGDAVRVEMGQVTLSPAIEAQRLPWGEAQHQVAVDVGNPHLVLFGDWDAATISERGLALGAPETTLRGFPNGVNVGFCRRRGPSTLELSVWERGVGFTRACGSGAVAAAAAAVFLGELAAGDLRVEQPGGDLRLEVSDGKRQSSGNYRCEVAMTGPAEPVFAGEIQLGRFYD